MSVDQTQQTDVRSVKERLLHYRVANTFVSVCAARSSDTSDPGQRFAQAHIRADCIRYSEFRCRFLPTISWLAP
jgi:hypothetical protein